MPHETSQTAGLRGRILHTPAFGELEEWRDGVILWDDAGIINAVGDAAEVLRNNPRATVVETGGVILPGLVDAHAHLPQAPVCGLGAGELLPWLHKYVFPRERTFDAEAAETLAPDFFRSMAANGATTACLFLAIWEESAEVCFAAAESSGLRVTMGKMMMDDVTYDDILPARALDLSLEQTERLCRRWHGVDKGRIRYAVSPRFAVACSDRLMKEAGALANNHGAMVQTHLSENQGELRVVAERFPTARDYTDVYDRCGLLGPRTLMGHSIHLSDREIARLAATGTRAIHCPTSNLYLSSGLMNFAALREAGVVVGLGSDVAGGPELSMWRVMRAALEVRNIRASMQPNTPPLDPRHALYLATKGGAEALGLSAETGSLEVGKEADILVIDPATAAPLGVNVQDLSADELVSMCVWRGDDRLTRDVYVRGKGIEY